MIYNNFKDLKLGKCEKITIGKDVTIVAIGKMVSKAYEISKIFSNRNSNTIYDSV